MVTETGLTGEIADWIARSPAPAQTGTAELGIADCIAVMHAGWAEPATADLRRIDGLPDWPAPLSPQRDDPARLALHLASAAHALDFDDTAFGGHPSAVLVPALLAEAAVRATTGTRLLAAYGASYETWAELMSLEPDSVHGKSWHPSAVYGPVAATAALCRLRGLPDYNCRSALSLAASMSGGDVAQFGTPAKPWQLGRAAAAAFEAMALAQAGMAAAPDALERALGFLAAISPHGRVRRDGLPDLGQHMARNGLNIKRYPVCCALYRVLDALELMLRDHPIRPCGLATIQVKIGAAQAAMLHHDRPLAAAEARFSLPFAVAAMLLRGRQGPTELDPVFIRSDAVQAIYLLLRVHTLEGRHQIEPSLSPFDRVTLHPIEGEPISSGPVGLPLGHFGNPAPADAIDRKIAECLTIGPVSGNASRPHALLRGLADLPDTAALIACRQETARA